VQRSAPSRSPPPRRTIDDASEERPVHREQEDVAGRERSEVGFGTRRYRDPRDHDRELASRHERRPRSDAASTADAAATSRDPSGGDLRRGTDDRQRQPGRA
jgi:hypothetical protein